MNPGNPVDDFMAKLDHPLKTEIEAIRRIILGADPAIAEGIKWNAPSFRTTEYFATANLRAKGGIGIILHLGAKARDIPDGSITVEDPSHLLKWLAKDRVMVQFKDMQEINTMSAEFQDVVRQWIKYA